MKDKGIEMSQRQIKRIFGGNSNAGPELGKEISRIATGVDSIKRIAEEFIVQVKSLGWSVSKIAKMSGLDRKCVRRFLAGKKVDQETIDKIRSAIAPGVTAVGG